VNNCTVVSIFYCIYHINIATLHSCVVIAAELVPINDEFQLEFNKIFIDYHCDDMLIFCVIWTAGDR